jgi:hypothetical protein
LRFLIFASIYYFIVVAFLMNMMSAADIKAAAKAETEQRSSKSAMETTSSEKDAPDQGQADEGIVYPSGMKVALIMVSLYLALFLVALVRLCLQSAIRRELVQPSFCQVKISDGFVVGPHHHRNCSPSHYR